MKRRPKTALTPLQRKRLVRISCCILLFTVLWIVFAPGKGLFFLSKQKKHLFLLQTDQKALIQKNIELQQDVERLQNDEEFLEKVAREEHGMLKENEIIFDFTREKKK